MADVDNILDFMLNQKNRYKGAKDTYKQLKGSRKEAGIRGKAKDLILQYPVLVSDAITLESVSAVMRTLEHEYANLLTLLINDNFVVSKNGSAYKTSDYLGQFHNNVMESTEIGKWAFKEANMELNTELISTLINENSLNEYTVDKEAVKFFNEDRETRAKEKHEWDREKHQMSKEKHDWDSDSDARAAKKHEWDREKHGWSKNKEDRDAEKHGWAKDKENRDKEKHGWAKNKETRDKEKHDWSKNKETRDAEKYKTDMYRDRLDFETKRAAGIVPNDAKKINDAVPTLIKGVINYTDENGSNIPKLINFGIKCICHPVASTEMKFNLGTKVENPSLLMKFISWTTGEKKLLTDLVMERKTMKNLAATKLKSNYWFRKLEKMSNKAENIQYFRKFIKKVPGADKVAALLNLDRELPIPIVSLVVSKAEVDQVAAEYGIDLLSKPGFAKEVMDKFYLLSLVVVDDVSSTAYFYNDVSGRFIQYSMKQLKGFAKDDMLTPEEALKKSLMR